MNEGAKVITLLGIPFNVGNCLSGLAAAIIVFLLVFVFSRNIQMKPKGKQNALEWLIDFTNNIVKANIPDEQGRNYQLFSFTLFVLIFISNQIGLMIQFSVGDVTYLKSPTASPMTTLTLALLVMVLADFCGVTRFGFKGYFKNSYLSPMPALFPIELLEDFTNFLTLALRLYGNIFAGEVLLTTIRSMDKAGWLGTISSVPLEMIWQGFSVFIGSIQAYVFVTLTMVYISQKVEKE
ncbi:F0F1 ATP synthase subunit A [Ligilactobacillus acidipiscis DSM 15836]|uniref:ATP synthase subunit a n=1 Tax=Ligilactobacillus acidipiscis DSM 15836 TaxID=1423716 RepID=A0ABR5PL88_9LACO|nr:F0F1 ATP synthase subunit A [Ligilactobacillus acidipiscis]KRM28219.1 F0F1 ATP synthase subunit A [Ligilactobacillus acidipiscis DSM 15836]GAW64114.1 F0F1 ATP synthase subunit A [Ligilactobacillus acidipiscis]GEN21173.1 ATP synthase subunit a [Ligilactobacillus acidipiscis]